MSMLTEVTWLKERSKVCDWGAVTEKQNQTQTLAFR